MRQRTSRQKRRFGHKKAIGCGEKSSQATSGEDGIPFNRETLRHRRSEVDASVLRKRRIGPFTGGGDVRPVKKFVVVPKE